MGPMGKLKKLNYDNSGCMQDRVVIFDSMGFTGTAYLTASFKFTSGLGLCMGQLMDAPCIAPSRVTQKIFVF